MTPKVVIYIESTARSKGSISFVSGKAYVKSDELEIARNLSDLGKDLERANYSVYRRQIEKTR